MTRLRLRYTRRGWFFGVEVNAGYAILHGPRLDRWHVYWFGPYPTADSAYAKAHTAVMR